MLIRYREKQFSRMEIVGDKQSGGYRLNGEGACDMKLMYQDSILDS